MFEPLGTLLVPSNQKRFTGPYSVSTSVTMPTWRRMNSADENLATLVM